MLRWFCKSQDPIEGVIESRSETPTITWDNLFSVINNPEVRVAIQIDPRIIHSAFLVVTPRIITPLLRRIKEMIDAGQHPGLRFSYNKRGTVLISAKPDPVPDHLYSESGDERRIPAPEGV